MMLCLGRAGFQQLQVLFPSALDWCWEHQKLAKHDKSLLTLAGECLSTGLLGLLLWPRKLSNHPGCTTRSCDLVHTLPAEKLTVGVPCCRVPNTFCQQRFFCHCNYNSQPLHCFNAWMNTLGAVGQVIYSMSCPRAARGWKCYWQPGRMRRDVSSCRMEI